MLTKIREALTTKIPNGSFVRNVLILTTGTTFAQAITVLAAPLLTRLYSPEDFGVYTLYVSILAVLAIVACGQYEVAIVLPEKDKDAANILLISIIICFGLASLTFILVSVFGSTFTQLFGILELAGWLWFLPLSLIAAGLFQAFNYWSTRRAKFKLLAMRQITMSTVMLGTQIGTGGLLYPAGPGGLIVGSIVGQAVATARLAWHTIKNDRSLLRNSLSLKRIKTTLKEYKRFPLYLGSAGLLNVSAEQVPVILLGYYFGTAVVGSFSLAVRVANLPFTVIANSISQVFYPRASKAYIEGTLHVIVLNMFTRIFSFVLVPILLLMISGPDLISLIFGVNWVIAGEYLIWLGPRFISQFISAPLSTVFVILNRQDLNLKIDTLLFITNIGTVIFGGFLGDSLMTVKLFGAGTFACYSFACFLIFKISGVPNTTVLKQIYNTLLRAIPYTILPLMIVLLTDSSIFVTIISILCGVLFLYCNARSFLKMNR
ncbi:oligosaccharide flippase family protein [Syntrophomonas wolfei]|jgi:O-antigen/teichoic acid export membrane protein|uniref:oligosaccharide flippase family protein n=1 Tax=Syntrophomonas wolfei TaxID=863 RepID=UPI0023F17517|nr:oligosaccharide flippase family protein [Syntrophomonas wolfei]